MTKGPDWENEHEWRMLAPLQRATEVVPSEPLNVHLFAFPKAMISAVIFGAYLEKRAKDRIVSTITKDPEYRHVRLQQATIDPTHYKINLMEVDR
jgi:hypothetical protein